MLFGRTHILIYFGPHTFNKVMPMPPPLCQWVLMFVNNAAWSPTPSDLVATYSYAQFWLYPHPTFHLAHVPNLLPLLPSYRAASLAPNLTPNLMFLIHIVLRFNCFLVHTHATTCLHCESSTSTWPCLHCVPVCYIQG